jgi:hypothetical protein
MRALVLVCACAGVAGASLAAAPPAMPQPAAWVPHEVLVQYKNLPVAYTCDALWYKVGDILRAVGAWTYVSITPRDCKPQTTGDGLSPSLSVHFLALETLAPSAARWAQTHAVIGNVDLRAGNPKSLDAGDCELLRQTGEDLLSVMGAVQVGSTNLQCGAGPATHYYDLSLHALQAVPAPPAFVARSSAGR